MIKIKTNKEFVSYLKTLLNRNTVYMWGEFGRLVTNNTIDGKKKQYPSHYDDTKVKYLKSLVGKNYYAYDCAGLIKSYFMSDYGNKKVSYIVGYDKDAYGITVGNASEKGDISTLPEEEGVLLYMKGHCGVYIGDGKVIECTSNQKISGIKYGKVCISNLSARPWKTWTKSKWLSYVKDEPVIVKEDEIKEEPKIEEPDISEPIVEPEVKEPINNDNEDVNKDVTNKGDNTEIKEDKKTLFERIWQFILKILDLIKVKK